MKRLVLLLTFSVALGGCSWITSYFSGDDNAVPPRELTELKNEINITRVWSLNAGQGTGEQLIRLQPVIVGDSVYVATRDGHINRYKLADGKLLQEIKTGNKLSAGPGVGFGLLVVGTRNAEVQAYSMKTGKQVWSVPVSSEVLSVPAITGNRIIIRTSDGRLTALAIKDGKKVWDLYKREPALTLRGTSRPVAVGDNVFSGFDNGQLVSVNLQNGRQNWRRRIAVPSGRTELERIVDLDADPVVSNGVIYVAAYQGHLAAINLADGQLIWQRDLSSYAGMVVDGVRLFVTDDSSQVLSIHTRNGASLWRQDKLKWRSLTAPVVHGSYVIAGDFEGYLHWMDRKDGHLVARTRGDTSGFSVAPVSNSTYLISLGRSGELTAFQIQKAK